MACVSVFQRIYCPCIPSEFLTSSLFSHVHTSACPTSGVQDKSSSEAVPSRFEVIAPKTMTRGTFQRWYQNDEIPCILVLCISLRRSGSRLDGCPHLTRRNLGVSLRDISCAIFPQRCHGAVVPCLAYLLLLTAIPRSLLPTTLFHDQSGHLASCFPALSLAHGA